MNSCMAGSGHGANHVTVEALLKPRSRPLFSNFNMSLITMPVELFSKISQVSSIVLITSLRHKFFGISGLRLVWLLWLNTSGPLAVASSL